MQSLKSHKTDYEELLFFRLFIDQEKKRLFTKTTQEEHYYKLWTISVANKIKTNHTQPINRDVYKDVNYDSLLEDIFSGEIKQNESYIYLLDLKDITLGRSEIISMEGEIFESNMEYMNSRDKFTLSNYYSIFLKLANF